jgi:YebC/PmpR family DNA-binding regulatory protein
MLRFQRHVGYLKCLRLYQYCYQRNFAGHNKWSKIRHKKGANDLVRSKMVTKMLRSLSIAVREAKQKNIGDIAKDHKVMQAKALALRAGCTKANIEKALKPSAKADNEVWERILYECNMGNYCFVVECYSENRKRTAPLVKHVLTKNGGTLGTTGSVMWAFDERGIIEATPKEGKVLTEEEFDNIFVAAVDAGAEDVELTEDCLVILCDTTDLSNITDVVRDCVAQVNYEIVASEFTYLPKDTVTADSGDTFSNVLNSLEDLEDVQNVYHNVDVR